MKKLFITSVLLGMYFYSPSQMIVAAPDVTAALTSQGIDHKLTMLQQLAESVKQTMQLTESAAALKKSAEAIEKVSSTIKNVQLVKKTLDKQTTLAVECGQMLKDVSKIKRSNNTSFLQLEDNINEIIKINKGYIDVVSNMLQDGRFNMNDADRLKMFLDIDKAIDEHRKTLNDYYITFESVNMMRNFVITNF